VAVLRERLGEDEVAARAVGARYDPARVLREVEAKRALLTGHEGVHRCDWGEHRGGDFTPCKQVVTLAAVYRDHPDYDPEWVHVGMA
jgi:hypothetical protein